MTQRHKSEESSDWVGHAFGHAFARDELCRAALTHRSAGGNHNERLEFLGDSVLNCVVARALYDAYPDADEGDLSRLRATLVSGDALARIAGDLGVGEHLRLGQGEMKSGGHRRASILADALEAMVGAIYLDGGFEAAARSVQRFLGTHIARLPAAESLKDAKTRLQEALQARGLALPVYALTGAVGEPHAQSFTVTCEVPTFGLIAVGEGGSRRGAEQSAARKILDLLPCEMRKSP
ncbi:MAG TPA: ribonuclease III [Steroidobacteraceae bacterium]|nr:ribonuclease III [Steroidobacteraceae bacterium]